MLWISITVQARRYVRDLRLPSRLKLSLPSSGVLRCIKRFETDVSGLPVGPVFKGQAVQEGQSFWDCLTVDHGADI